MPSGDRIVLVFVNDRNGRPLRGADVFWSITVDGESVEFGPATTQGEPTSPVQAIIPASYTGFVDVTASYNGKKKQTQRVNPNPHSNPVFNLDVAPSHPPHRQRSGRKSYE